MAFNLLPDIFLYQSNLKRMLRSWANFFTHKPIIFVMSNQKKSANIFKALLPMLSAAYQATRFHQV